MKWIAKIFRSIANRIDPPPPMRRRSLTPEVTAWYADDTLSRIRRIADNPEAQILGRYRSDSAFSRLVALGNDVFCISCTQFSGTPKSWIVSPELLPISRATEDALDRAGCGWRRPKKDE